MIRVASFKVVLLLVGLAAAVAGCGEAAAIKHYNEGVDYYHEGKLGLAEQQYKLALQEDAGLAEAYLNLGIIYLDKGWIEGAEEHTQKAIDLLRARSSTIVLGATADEIISIGYNNLGIIEIQKTMEMEMIFDFAEAENHWRKAMDLFHQALELDPDNPEANANIRLFRNAY